MQVLCAAAENIAPRAMQDGKPQQKRQKAKKAAADASKKPLTAFFAQAAGVRPTDAHEEGGNTEDTSQTKSVDATAPAPAAAEAVEIVDVQPKEQPKKVHPFFAGPRPAAAPAVVDLVQQQQQPPQPKQQRASPTQPEVEDLTVAESVEPQPQPIAVRRASARAASIRAATSFRQQDRDSDFAEVAGVSSDEDEQPKRRKTAAKAHAPGGGTSAPAAAGCAATAKQTAAKPRPQPSAPSGRKRGLMDHFLKTQGEPVEEGSKLQEELARSREATVTFFGGREINPFFLAPSKRPATETVSIDLCEADNSPSMAPTQWVDVVFPAQQHVFAPETTQLSASTLVPVPGLLINGRPAAVRRRSSTVDVCAFRPRVSDVSDLYKYCAAALGAFQSVYNGAAPDVAAGSVRAGQLLENPSQAGPFICPPADEVSSRADLRAVWEASVECQRSGDSSMADIADQFGGQLKLQPDYVHLLLSAACERAEDPCRASMLWVEKHRPTKSSELCGNSSAILEFTSWLKQWSSKRKNPPKPKPRKSRRGWDSDDDSFDDDLCKLAVLYGKNGTCKTTTVYTCAAQLGYNVLEVKPDEKRQGAELRKRLAEATQSHRVSSKLDGESAALPPQHPAEHRKRGRPRRDDDEEDMDYGTHHAHAEGSGELTLVLFEQADIYFEDENGFYATIKELAKSAKCPLVITSESSLTAELPAVDHLPLAFEPPTTVELVFRLAVVCHAEKLSLSAKQLVQLAHCCGHDIRAALNSLQMHAIQTDAVPTTLPLIAWNRSCDFAQLHRQFGRVARQTIGTSPGRRRCIEFLPLLVGVQPRVLRHGEQCVIYGSGFLQSIRTRSAADGEHFAQVTVMIASCRCESVLLSDEKISVSIPSHLRPGIHQVVVRVGNYTSTMQHGWDATVKVVEPLAETSRDEVESRTSDDFNVSPPSPEMRQSTRDQAGGRLRKLTSTMEIDSDDDFADTPPGSVRDDKRSKRQRIIQDDDDDDGDSGGDQKAEENAVGGGQDAATEQAVQQHEEPRVEYAFVPFTELMSPPGDLPEHFHEVSRQRAEAADRLQTVGTVAKLPSHVLFQCAPGEGAAADANALDDIASALDAYSTADFLSNWPQAADGDDYCTIGPHRLGVDVRNLSEYVLSPLALEDETSSSYEWSSTGPAVATSLRFLARSRLQARMPTWPPSDNDLGSCAESLVEEAQLLTPTPAASDKMQTEQIAKQSVSSSNQAQHKEFDARGEDEEFELDMDVAAEPDDDAAASQSSALTCGNTAVSALRPDDLLADLLAQELLRARLFRCTALMQYSQVDKFRSPQLLQGGGAGVLLDYIPYMAMMMRLDASSPYAKTTGRRGRMNRMRQATNLDGAQLDEVAGIGNIRACEDFRESVLHTAQLSMDLRDKQASTA